VVVRGSDFGSQKVTKWASFGQSGLQNLHHRFDSGRRLQASLLHIATLQQAVANQTKADADIAADIGLSFLSGVGLLPPKLLLHHLVGVQAEVQGIDDEQKAYGDQQPGDDEAELAHEGQHASRQGQSAEEAEQGPELCDLT
jgi:hypothetical protein